MKRYEKYNILTGRCESVETQAAGMMIAELQEKYNLDLEVLEGYAEKFKKYVNFLNEEVEE